MNCVYVYNLSFSSFMIQLPHVILAETKQKAILESQE